MKKLFLMIISVVCSILPLEKILACYHGDKDTHFYTYDDGTIGSTFISGKTVNQTCVNPGGSKAVDEYDKYGRKIKQTTYGVLYGDESVIIKNEKVYDEDGNITANTQYRCQDGNCSISSISEYEYYENSNEKRSMTLYKCSNNTCYNYNRGDGSCTDEGFFFDKNGNVTEGYTGECGGTWYTKTFSCDSNKICKCDETGKILDNFGENELSKPKSVRCLSSNTYADGSQCKSCPSNAESCYLDDNNRMVTTCEGEYKEQNGNCVSSCGADYRDMGEWCNRIRWTPAEAAKVLRDDNTNEITITFKK